MQHNMRVLVACEFSGVVREAFVEQGYDAVSCDVLPSERPGKHIQDDIRNVNLTGYDLLIAHPPCTYLACSGARWFHLRQQEQQEALDFVQWLMNAPVARIAIENPIGVISTCIRKPDQIIQPWMFGHGETKATCLWLKNLPKLQPTNIVSGRKPACHYVPPGKERWKVRSRTYTGIAKAMASQWSSKGQIDAA